MSDVLVGIDPRDLSVPALVWAADESGRRGARLRLVAAVSPGRDRLAYGATAHQSSLRVRAESALANAEDLVQELHSGLWTATELVDGTPAAVLYERTRGAALAVVGSRRLGRAAEVLSEGSVVVPLTARAHCPVVVIREPEHTAVHPPMVVVGVDGSRDCRAAVAFAAAEASLREARLMAVWVRPRPLPARGDESEDLAGHRRLLAESVAGCAERHPDVDIEQVIMRGHPVEELTRASREALAVVVGRRGRGGHSGMRLGSTVHGLLHRAACPVITVPLPGGGGTDGAPSGADRSRSPTDRPAPQD
ncbi:universal stress protein [Streptomyces nymphaeiformis]|uniref:Nucleotide-binding universal stress UspA family protein n=1 Tax=Streptomyces nymphaeiformis TaxID=2663842 RepID=A0A7W7XD79_9ACTN|nr:universal stress protein [Streptomyces nymphaeiformis]MBB4983915.1 nucleotide-binding universal stress UspA family protein [Streptomyces nymphaeiformis]